MSNKVNAHFLRPIGCAEANGGEEEIAEGMEWHPLYITHSRKRTSSFEAGAERGPCAGLASVVPAHLEHFLLEPGLSRQDPCSPLKHFALCTPLLVFRMSAPEGTNLWCWG